MGSALLDTTGTANAGTGSSSTETLRLEVAERLAAHRTKRGLAGGQEAGEARRESARPSNSKAARIAATVAERYAQTQSYHAFLAAEAERAVQQARAAAEIAELNAQAVAAAQQRLLDTLQQQDEPVETPRLQPEMVESRAEQAAPEVLEQRAEEFALWPEVEAPAKHAAPARARRAVEVPQSADQAPAALTVRLYEDGASAVRLAAAEPAGGFARRAQEQVERTPDEARALDEEIAFRQSPVFEEVAPPTPLPANLIEFPRQLVAARKARPRYAEGPLREDGGPESGDGQLRIFEVDPAQISTSPEADDSPAPQWTSIWLDAPSQAAPAAAGEPVAEMHAHIGEMGATSAALPQVATIGRRMLAAGINGCLMLAGLAVFAATFLAATGHVAEMQSAAGIEGLLRANLGRDAGAQRGLVLGAVAAVGGFLFLLYNALFFTFSSATPGMRCTRIALCTFDEENPTRKAMRRRILALLMSAIPLGLGFFWAALDEERLAWHDRVARMYQRSY